MAHSIPSLRSTVPSSWRAGLVLAVLTCILAAPAPLLAHAELVSSDPLPNASLVEAPDGVAMTFSEPIDAANASVQLLDAQLRAIDGVGPVTLDQGGTLARVDLPSLEPGVYTVSYQVVSTVDGHATAGIFAFVIDPTGAQAPPTSPPTSSSPSVDAWTVAARWLALLTALVGLGYARDLVAGRAFDARGTCAERRSAAALASAGRRFGRKLRWPGALPRALGAPDRRGGWIPARYRCPVRLDAVRDRDARLPAVRADCRRRRGRRGADAVPPRARRSSLLAGGSLAISLAGMSFAGHASALGGPLNAAIDWLHLVAAAAWLGGVLAVYTLATRVRKVGASVRSVAAEMLRRHGRLALVAAPLVVLTGLANSPLVLGTSRELVASSYGNLLLVKAALVEPRAGHRRHEPPPAPRSRPGPLGDPGRSRAADRGRRGHGRRNDGDDSAQRHQATGAHRPVRSSGAFLRRSRPILRSRIRKRARPRTSELPGHDSRPRRWNAST